MAQGMRTVNFAERKVKTFALLPPDKYTLKLMGPATKVSKADKPGAVPYVQTAFEVLGTATHEGGQNRRVYHNFWLKTVPGDDGTSLIEGREQLVAFARAVGETPELPEQDFATVKLLHRDADGSLRKAKQGESVDETEQENITILGAAEVKEWLVQHDGVEVQARIKVEKGTGGYDDKNKVDRFIYEEAAEGSDAFAPPAEDASVPEEAAPPPPPPPPARPAPAKPAPKAPAKPAPKQAAKRR
jgi:hypothetical protein